MIPVSAVRPPPGFTTRVVRPAKAWAARKGWRWSDLPPAGHANELPNHWTRCLDDLHDRYGGACAYLCVYTHRSLQASSADHFVPKSRAPVREAYNWANYRLACRAMNTNKHEFQDVLEPFLLPAHLFFLNLLSGRVQVNGQVAAVRTQLRSQAQDTIKRLKLNAGEFRDLRLKFVDEYLRHRQLANPEALDQARQHLRLQSPFIHQEVVRQGW